MCIKAHCVTLPQCDLICQCKHLPQSGGNVLAQGDIPITPQPLWVGGCAEESFHEKLEGGTLISLI